MHFKFVVPVLATLAFAAPALAQDAAAPASRGMAHAEMCDNHYAGAVGKLAALEVKLKLSAAQKPLFERWKKVRLANAKDHADKCATMKMPGRDMAIMDAVRHHTAMLEMRLADLKAETPALEALVASLDADQQQTLKRAALRAMHHRMDKMHHGRHGGHGMRDGMRGHGMRGMQGQGTQGQGMQGGTPSN